MADTETEYWYRYVDCTCSAGVELKKYAIVKRTPKGVWLRSVYNDGIFVGSKKRFVLYKSRKRFACPTVEEAKESFIKRKEAQIRIYFERISRAKRALNKL